MNNVMLRNGETCRVRTKSSTEPLNDLNFRLVLSDYFTSFYPTSNKALYERMRKNKRAIDGFSFRLVM